MNLLMNLKEDGLSPSLVRLLGSGQQTGRGTGGAGVSRFLLDFLGLFLGCDREIETKIAVDNKMFAVEYLHIGVSIQ